MTLCFDVLFLLFFFILFVFILLFSPFILLMCKYSNNGYNEYCNNSPWSIFVVNQVSLKLFSVFYGGTCFVRIGFVSYEVFANIEEAIWVLVALLLFTSVDNSAISSIRLIAIPAHSLYLQTEGGVIGEVIKYSTVNILGATKIWVFILVKTAITWLLSLLPHQQILLKHTLSPELEWVYFHRSSCKSNKKCCRSYDDWNLHFYYIIPVNN